jgi:hypothetical protein
LTALVWLGIGLAGLIAPAWLLSPMTVTATDPIGFSELRAMYGGLELGLAGFTGWCAATGRVREGLLISIVTVGGLSVGRLIGVFVDGSTDPMLLFLMVLEGSGAALGIYGLATLSEET